MAPNLMQMQERGRGEKERHVTEGGGRGRLYVKKVKGSLKKIRCTHEAIHPNARGAETKQTRTRWVSPRLFAPGFVERVPRGTRARGLVPPRIKPNHEDKENQNEMEGATSTQSGSLPRTNELPRQPQRCPEPRHGACRAAAPRTG